MPIESRGAGVDERASLLPAEIVPLFDDAFVRTCDLYEEYVHRLTRRLCRAAGLEDALASPATVDEAIARAGLDPRVARAPVLWMLRMLAARGAVDVDGDGETIRFRLARAGDDLDPEETRAAQARHDPRALPSYAIAALAVAHAPAVLRGELSGEQALFGADRLAAWAEYFSNDNVLYAVGNAIGAIACEAALREAPGPILELGGGLGSGALAVLARGAAATMPYRFTEMSIPFLRRAQKTLTAAWPHAPLTFARLDMNRPFAEAGVEPGRHALVWAANALHVAHDLAFTLAEIRAALAPGGTLVAAECVRPFTDQPVHVELVFNLLESFRDPVLVPGWRPNGGFLTPEQWTAALEANGFRDVALVPDVARVRQAYPSFVVAAVTARRA